MNAGWLIIRWAASCCPAGHRARPRGGLALRVRRLDRGRGAADAAALLSRARRAAARRGAAPELVHPAGAAFADLRQRHRALSRGALLELLYPFALVLGVALSAYARRLARWPFGAPWWAFTFRSTRSPTPRCAMRRTIRSRRGARSRRSRSRSPRCSWRWSSCARCSGADPGKQGAQRAEVHRLHQVRVEAGFGAAAPVFRQPVAGDRDQPRRRRPLTIAPARRATS